MNPRPVSMLSSRANHGKRLATGNWAKPTVEGPKWACQGRLQRAARAAQVPDGAVGSEAFAGG